MTNPDNSAGIPHYNKGLILERRGLKAEAVDCYLEAVRLAPEYFEAHANLGRLLCEVGKLDDAIEHCCAALHIKANSPRVHNNLATAFYQKGKWTETVRHYTIALGLAPEDADVYENLAKILKHHPELAENPSVLDAKKLLSQLAERKYTEGMQMLKADTIADAIKLWREAIRFDPEWPELLNNLAWILATYPDPKIRAGKEAVDLAKRAVKLVGDRFPRFQDTLAAAHAESGRFDEAKRIIEKTMSFVKANGPLELAEKLPFRFKLYQSGQPLREPLE